MTQDEAGKRGAGSHRAVNTVELGSEKAEEYHGKA